MAYRIERERSREKRREKRHKSKKAKVPGILLKLLIAGVVCRSFLP